MEKLFKDTASLYHLDQHRANTTESLDKKDLGKLPGPSVALIVTLIVVWLLLGGYYLSGFIIGRKK